eukprot:GILJ01003287.1.p1 GENE.GILJ01003287.1~~GILJ01003287.1.p1  ORF type:complete len:203 (-),score=11.78 GILJ01003287.1:885-1460(-)
MVRVMSSLLVRRACVFGHRRLFHDRSKAQPALSVYDETEEVKKANKAFYLALESLDPDRMINIWYRHSSVRCCLPDSEFVYGYDNVLSLFSKMFSGLSSLIYSLDDLHITQLSGSAAVVSLSALVKFHKFQGHHDVEKDGLFCPGRLISTCNIFEKKGHRWYLTHHQSARGVAVTAAADARSRAPLRASFL